jgi:hypothetical protein
MALGVHAEESSEPSVLLTQRVHLSNEVSHARDSTAWAARADGVCGMRSCG